MSEAPRCPYCHQPMQLNNVVNTPTVTQYLCGCTGTLYYKNVVSIGTLELKRPERKSWLR